MITATGSELLAARLCRTVALVSSEGGSAEIHEAEWWTFNDFNPADGRVRTGALKIAPAAQVHPDAVFADLRTILRDRLAPLSAAAREEALALLRRALDWDLEPSDRAELSRSLLASRDALRERLPPSAQTTEARRAVSVDSMVGLDESSYFIKGWMYDRDAPVASLVAVAPHGERVELIARAVRGAHRRFDGSAGLPSGAPGFAARFTTKTPCPTPDGWRIEIRGSGGDGVEARAPSATDDAEIGRRSVLDMLSAEFVPSDAVIEEHIVSSVETMQARMRRQAVCAQVVQFGRAPELALASVIVVLDGRNDRLGPLEHQLAHFVRDGSMPACDLVYVIAQRDWSARLAELAGNLFELYRIPFRLAVLARPADCAGSVDVAVSLATSPVIVVLGADVVPDGDGWASRLAAFVRAAPGAGLIVPKVAAYNEGGEAGDPHVVESLRTECFAIDRDVLLEAGGLSGRYLSLPFEAQDLSRRLVRTGRANWYLPDVLLYSLPVGPPPSAAEQRYDEWVAARSRRSD